MKELSLQPICDGAEETEGGIIHDEEALLGELEKEVDDLTAGQEEGAMDPLETVKFFSDGRGARYSQTSRRRPP